MRTIAKGNFSGLQKPVQMVITNTTQWTKVWEMHSVRKSPAEKVPEINFDKETVLFVALGRKSTGGHAVEISAIKESQGKSIVFVKTRAPAPGGIQLQAITAPFHAVAVPRITGEVKFVLEAMASRTK